MTIALDGNEMLHWMVHHTDNDAYIVSAVTFRGCITLCELPDLKSVDAFIERAEKTFGAKRFGRWCTFEEHYVSLQPDQPLANRADPTNGTPHSATRPWQYADWDDSV
jgi:hypothetical protein